VGGCVFAKVSTTLVGPDEVRNAIAVLTSPGGKQCGIVRFRKTAYNVVLVEGEVQGLAVGLHGIHIHEKGDISLGASCVGGHFNPSGKHHGGPQDEERHVGDLGNVEVADSTLVTRFRFEDSLLRMEGPHSIIGRSVVINADKDDLGRGNFPDSLTNGHSGARLCWGVIGRSG